VLLYNLCFNCCLCWQVQYERSVKHTVLWSVSRFRCRSDLYEMDLLIDINVDVYPMEVGLHLLCSLCSLSFYGQIPASHVQPATHMHAPWHWGSPALR